MKAVRKNCWEYRQCGREPEGVNAATLGVCPAAMDPSYNGINGGKNGGRFCWAVAGTFCGNKIQGTYAEKRASCLDCSFFRLVQKDEGPAKLNQKFLRFISDEERSPYFDNMTLVCIPAGTRFITQGAVEDNAYIIEKGSCLVLVEKDGELHPVDHYGEGDIAGGLGILTGEPRHAHVEAETNMEVWVLNRKHFEDISAKDPDVLAFLTEVVADRFDSRRPTAYRTIGKYLATNIIGRGGYSIVYQGIHKTLNMPVAIKMMRHNMAMDKDFINSFRVEAQTIAALNHENILRVYDFEERYRTLFIIMELLEGESLMDLLPRLGKLSVPLTVNFLLQICNGLEYAHEKGIIHRDINTDNIFIAKGDRVKILDFGLACPIGTEDFSFSGTVAYMAPEQINCDPVDPRTDIYSLGIVAYEMVTGQRPFPEEDIHQLMDLHLTQDIPDPAPLDPDVPMELRNFIMTCGRVDMDRRYQNMAQVRAALQPLANRFGIIHKESAKALIMKNICLIYTEEQQLTLSRRMEEFFMEIKRLGVVAKVADFKNAETLNGA